MKDKSSLISKIALWVLMFVGLGFFLLISFGGSVDPDAEYVEPVYTNAFILLMYAYVAIAALIVVVSESIEFVKGLIKSPVQALKSVLVFALLAVLLIITWILAPGDAVTILSDDAASITHTTYKMVDAQLFTMYTLVGVAAFAAIFGSFAKKIK